jgi:O-antigen/teichoic acid export membrane protein
MRRMQNPWGLARLRARLGGRQLLRGSLHLLAGHLLRIAIQSAYFVLTTRGLGVEDFGRYTGLQALLLGLVSFTSLGYPILALRAVARDARGRAAIWSGGLRVTLALGGLCALAVTLLGPSLLRIDFPRLPLLMIAVAELVVYAVLILLSGIMQGDQRLDRMAMIEVGLALCRLAVVGAVAFAGGLDLSRFAAAHLAGSCLWLFAALTVFGRGWAWPLLPVAWREIRGSVRDGLYIALAASGRSFLVGLDKMLLPAMAGLAIAGQYAAGYRVFAFALLPVQAFMSALYPRFFQSGQGSMAGSLALWRRSAPLVLAYALPMSLLLYFAAPLLGPILGAEYPEAPQVLRALIWVLLLQALYLPLGDALSGADHFGFRSTSILVAMLANLGLNLILIPRQGWQGAVLAVYLSHGLLLLLYVWGAQRALRSERAHG